ncbi:hypothetical protein XO10_05500 [Marinitoga sp. 1135]|nr:hypothetical protein [Marinitoga sp. 1135]NUU97661.1 hypothetical protein [Marinitoga sp. 1138]
MTEIFFKKENFIFSSILLFNLIESIISINKINIYITFFYFIFFLFLKKDLNLHSKLEKSTIILFLSIISGYLFSYLLYTTFFSNIENILFGKFSAVILLLIFTGNFFKFYNKKNVYSIIYIISIFTIAIGYNFISFHLSLNQKILSLFIFILSDFISFYLIEHYINSEKKEDSIFIAIIALKIYFFRNILFYSNISIEESLFIKPIVLAAIYLFLQYFIKKNYILSFIFITISYIFIF